MTKQRQQNSLLDPRCCSFKLSAQIREHIEQLIESDKVSKETKATLMELMDEDEANKNTLSYESLVKLHKYIQRADEDYVEPFYIFSETCKCIYPKARANKQLEERLTYLRLRDSQAIYNTMTSNVDRLVERKIEQMADRCDSSSSIESKVHSNFNNYSSESHSSELKKLQGSTIAVFNSFLVFICTFIFCYKALEYALPEPNYIVQVMFGLGGSTIVAIAELYFLMRVV